MSHWLVFIVVFLKYLKSLNIIANCFIRFLFLFLSIWVSSITLFYLICFFIWVSFECLILLNLSPCNPCNGEKTIWAGLPSNFLLGADVEKTLSTLYFLSIVFWDNHGNSVESLRFILLPFFTKYPEKTRKNIVLSSHIVLFVSWYRMFFM